MLSSSRARLSSAVVTSASAPRPEMSKALALAAFASMVEPSPALVFGRVFSSNFPEPAVTRASLLVRFGMNRSAACCGRRIVVFAVLARRTASFFDLSRTGVEVVLGPVPVNVHSDTPRSRCLGECLLLAIFDLGDCAYANFDTERETDREKRLEGSGLCIDCEGRGGVKGEELVETFVATLVVLVRGEGVRGILPPAVLVEKMPWWLFRGVATVGVAIVIDRMDKLMFRSVFLGRESLKISG